MKSLKEQYKDTFANIKLDNKKINDNLYRIIRENKKNNNEFNYRIITTIVILFVFILPVTAMISNKLNGIKIDKKENGEYLYSDAIFKLPNKINHNYFGCDLTGKCEHIKISVKDFENDLDVNVLSPKNNNYSIVPLYINLDNETITMVSLDLYNDGDFIVKTDDYNILTYKMNIKTVNEEKYEGNMITGKDSIIIHNNEYDFDAVTYLDERIGRIYFEYDNITYSIYINFSDEFINKSEKEKIDLLESIVNNLG